MEKLNLQKNTVNDYLEQSSFYKIVMIYSSNNNRNHNNCDRNS